ncbi:hypothetical protein DKX38_017616 [Salix brachista]|uniref:Reverse transcriptase zinc-binding domain-containing protein n=1 Tax=Salix brachista TaxID=2182728 RepID=A0A5N5KVR1_9ROSI|nr:hypothetical protein DKX38_017616 [Salix brachista]
MVKKRIELVASKVGKPLSCDESTFTCSRLDFARVCVELDAGTPFVHNFDIITPLSTEPQHIEVEYEWKPTRCASCNLFGHSCKMVEKVEPVKVPIDGGALEGTLLGEGCQRDINEKEKIVDLSNMCENKQNPTDTESSSAYTQRGKAKKGTNSQHNAGPTTVQPVKENRAKGKEVIVDTGHDLELVELDDVALKDVVRPHGHETQRCTGNKVAFFQSQNITGEGDTSSGDSPVVDTNETSENSSLAYTKVKKKKGGKKKGKEVLHENVEKVHRGLNLTGWNFFSNGTSGNTTRIIIGWDSTECNVHCIHSAQQWMTCEVRILNSNMRLTVTFVYGMNTPADRQDLWAYLCRHSFGQGQRSWLLMGDFNATLKASDSKGGDVRWAGHKNDFGYCLLAAQLHSISYSGLRYTWHNGQDHQNMILKKLDWVLGPPEMHEIWDKIKCKPQMDRADTTKWKGHSKGRFSIASAWNHIRKKKPLNIIASLAWFPDHVPRISFIFWLATRGRLATMDKPHVSNMISSNLCVLCGERPETHAHLFFQCSYSSRVWTAIISKVGIAIPPMRWDCLLQWAASHFHHKGKFDHMMVRHAITSSVYFLWQERNARVFNNKHKEAATIAKEAMMQLRILLLHFKKAIPSVGGKSGGLFLFLVGFFSEIFIWGRGIAEDYLLGWGVSSARFGRFLAGPSGLSLGPEPRLSFVLVFVIWSLSRRGARRSLIANRLTGSIPREFGSIATLESLTLEDNLLGGSLHPDLGNLRSLKRL